MRRTIALIAALVLVPAAAQAQAPATSFAELASLLKTGETVSVTDNAGRIVQGKVEQVSDTVLVLRRDQGDLSLAAPDVLRIARPRHPIRNGALIGLGVGLAVGVTVDKSQGCNPCIVRFAPAGYLLFGGLGTGIGAGIGTNRPRERVVFERTATGRARAAVGPMLPPGGVGVLMQIRW